MLKALGALLFGSALLFTPLDVFAGTKTNWSNCSFWKYPTFERQSHLCRLDFVSGTDHFRLEWSDGASDLFIWINNNQVVDSTGTTWNVVIHKTGRAKGTMYLQSLKNSTTIRASVQ